MRRDGWVWILVAALVGGCGAGGGGGGSVPPVASFTRQLSEEDVARVVSQAVGEALARGARAHVAVVDRVGNVLATYEMTGAAGTLRVASGLGVNRAFDGLELPAPFAAHAAISKAITAAYLSSNGNAFSTRTAGQIIQQHFNPQEAGQPSGPLFGVQISQLRCSDVVRPRELSAVGPRPSPLGLGADPGGLPLYKDGVLVGGIGVEVDGVYGLDLDITDVDDNLEERIATAGTWGLAAPADIRADRITADGRTLRFADAEGLASDPARAPALVTQPGALLAVAGYSNAAIRGGTEFGTAASGIRQGDSAARWILVGADGANRYPPVAGATLSAAEVEALLAEALAVALRARAQIRRPLGLTAQVTITVTDREGHVLGLVRTPDAPVFGIDVAVQKARTASLFSDARLTSFLAALATTAYEPRARDASALDYVADARAFFSDPQVFERGTAWSARAIGNLHRPTYPDGIDGAPRGPLSANGAWSPFNPGLQLDLVFGRVAASLLDPSSTGGCTQFAVPPGPGAYDPIANGIQIFPGAVPIYRGGALAGALGVSGDGVDQDDMVALLGVHNAGARLAGAIGNAPVDRRADRLTPQGTRLRYAQCPQSPFINSDEQNVCAGK